jgi:short-subunit dehydrogenase
VSATEIGTSASAPTVPPKVLAIAAAAVNLPSSISRLAGCAGTFADISLADMRKMLAVNARAPLELMHLFVQPMRAKARGHILNISSTSSCFPVPFEAAYSGTKHLLTATGRAVNAELFGSGVSVTTVCPGAVTTEFADVAGEQRALIFQLPLMVQSSEACAQQSLEAMFQCRAHAIIGIGGGGLYYFGEVVKGVLPERVLTSVVGLMFGVKL